MHKLLLSSSNISGYRDVHFLKNRKEKPWQAKVWRPWARDHISLGCFRRKQEAAVAVAVARAEGLEGQQSPDKSRAENSACPTATLSSLTFCRSSVAVRVPRADREKKARRRDARGRFDSDYFPMLREYLFAAASRAGSAVRSGCDPECLCKRRCGCPRADREKKARRRDTRGRFDSDYFPMLREYLFAAASRAGSAVRSGCDPECLCKRRCGRCAAHAPVCTTAGGYMYSARARPPAGRRSAEGSLSRFPRTRTTHRRDVGRAWLDRGTKACC